MQSAKIRFASLGFAIVTMGCATRNPGVDSESHFLCTTDSECHALGSGARCVSGVCQPPTALPSGSATLADDGGKAGAAITSSSPDAMSARGVSLPMATMASGQALPSAVAVDGTNVYWLNEGRDISGVGDVFADGQIMACPVSDCSAPTVVATGIGSSPPGANVKPPFAAGGGNVYWNSKPSDQAPELVKCAVGGCNMPDALVGSSVDTIAADGAALYWTTGKGLTTCTVANCNPRSLSNPNNPADFSTSGLVFDEDTAYWVYAGDIVKCGKAGCNGQSVKVVSMQARGEAASRDIAVDATNLYWTTLGSGAGSGQILKCAKTGCDTATVLVDKLYFPSSIATDGKNVYWSEDAEESCCGDGHLNCCSGDGFGRIAKCSVDGCDTPTTVAAHQAAATNLALDDSSVYFGTVDANFTTGKVIRVPK